ncbi:catalase, partial [Levilactobacillus brevis]|nr:catalase [Levilactobacillus brevis]
SQDMQWDFWAHSPESVHQVTILMSDRGIPASYRNMHGYGSHTFKWVNEAGEVFWVKYHFRTAQGIQNLSNDVAQRLAGENPDYLQADLYHAIEAGDFPTWKVCVQVIPEQAGLDYPADIFDVTQVVSQKDYPLIEIGEFTLNKNPDNYFEGVEEAAFSPANLVPGIEPSPDKLLQGRLFAYKDAARYRLGVNYEQLPANRPLNHPNNYERDEFMQTDNHGDQVNYEPNSQGGPQEDPAGRLTPYTVSGKAGNYAYQTDYGRAAGKLYRLLPADERQRLIETIVMNLGQVKSHDVKRLETAQFYEADHDYGLAVAKGLGLKLDEIKDYPFDTTH